MSMTTYPINLCGMCQIQGRTKFYEIKKILIQDEREKCYAFISDSESIYVDP